MFWWPLTDTEQVLGMPLSMEPNMEDLAKRFAILFCKLPAFGCMNTCYIALLCQHEGLQLHHGLRQEARGMATGELNGDIYI